MAKLASRYSTALFELASENNIDKYYDQICVLNEAICKDGEIMEYIKNPNFSSEEKFKTFEKIFKGNIKDDILGLISVVFSKNREKQLPEIFDGFIELVLENKGIMTAYVESAAPLKSGQIKKIKNKLSKNLDKQIVIKEIVDESLIGGLKITVDGHVIDGTIKKRIDDLNKMLIDNRLA
ncbi:MAG: ATP synthase F1 subunit delta [Clostridiales bacterium]|nr:ATP synthase F1 subunit delta [Clostridiales bacterium]